MKVYPRGAYQSGSVKGKTELPEPIGPLQKRVTAAMPRSMRWIRTRALMRPRPSSSGAAGWAAFLPLRLYEVQPGRAVRDQPAARSVLPAFEYRCESVPTLDNAHRRLSNRRDVRAPPPNPAALAPHRSKA